MSKEIIEYAMKPDAISVTSILKNHVCAYTQKTKQDYLNEEYIVAEWEKIEKLIEKNENEQLLTSWESIKEEDYYRALEELPPLKWENVENASFFMCKEAYSSNIHAVYCEYNCRFYATMRRTTTSYSEMLKEIKSMIESGKLD